MKIILFQYNGYVCMCVPTGELPVEDVANKDLPKGVPYLIVNKSDIPADQTFFDAWEVDFTNPDGYALGIDAWTNKQVQA